LREENAKLREAAQALDTALDKYIEGGAVKPINLLWCQGNLKALLTTPEDK
jgi:hypothetical protein